MRRPTKRLLLRTLMILTLGIAFAAQDGLVTDVCASPSDCGASLVSRCYCDLPNGKYTLKAKVKQGNGTQTTMAGGMYGKSTVKGGGAGGTSVLVTAAMASSSSVATVTVEGPNCTTVVTSFSADTAGLQECAVCP